MISSIDLNILFGENCPDWIKDKVFAYPLFFNGEKENVQRFIVFYFNKRYNIIKF